MSDDRPEFGIGLGSLIKAGWDGFRRRWARLLAAGIGTLTPYLLIRHRAQALSVVDREWAALLWDLGGLVISSGVAHLWYRESLAAVDDQSPGRVVSVGFASQIVASVWFGAAVLLGLRYLAGIPSILAGLFYAFYGFVIAEHPDRGGLRALGDSVRIGDRRRIGIFGVACVFGVINMFGLIGLGLPYPRWNLLAGLAGFLATSSVTMVAGAKLYRVLSSAQ